MRFFTTMKKPLYHKTGESRVPTSYQPLPRLTVHISRLLCPRKWFKVTHHQVASSLPKCFPRRFRFLPKNDIEIGTNLSRVVWWKVDFWGVEIWDLRYNIFLWLFSSSCVKCKEIPNTKLNRKYHVGSQVEIPFIFHWIPENLWFVAEAWGPHLSWKPTQAI